MAMQTQLLLEIHLPPVLASVVHSYTLYHTRDDYMIAFIGHGETCRDIKKPMIGLAGACRGGHREIVDMMIARGANNWNLGLSSACLDGHREIVELMIDHGANNWDWGLDGACRGGHRELFDLMITYGANNWNSGLHHACLNKNHDIVELMITHGAKKCNHYYQSLIKHQSDSLSK